MPVLTQLPLLLSKPAEDISASSALCLSAALLLVCGTAHATEETAPLELEATVVSATRTANNSFDLPMSVSSVSREQLDDAQAYNVSDVLETVPGVNFGGGPRAAGQIPTIRGLQGSRIVLTVDGARRNFDNGIYSPLLLDPDVIRQVEVVRGPVSALQGSGGLGGSMAFETLRAEDILTAGQAIGGRIKAGYRSANESSSTNLSTAARSANADILVSATYRDYGTLHTAMGAQHAEYSNDGQLKNALLKGSFTPNEQHRFEYSYQAFSDDFTGPNNPGGNALFPFSQDLLRRQDQYTGSWAFRDAGAGLVDGKISVYQTRFRLEGDSLSAPSNDMTSMTKTAGVNAQNTSRFELSSGMVNRLTYGVDFYKDTYESTSGGKVSTVTPDGQLRSVGLFVQNEADLGRWTLITALRQDNYALSSLGQKDAQHNRLSPKVAVKYQIIDALGVYASYGEAFRAPSTKELYGNLSTNSALFNFRANPTLNPEVVKTREIGSTLALDNMLYAGDKFRLKLSIFDENVEDLIQSTTVGKFPRNFPFSNMGPNGLIFQSQNVANAERHGGELEAAYVIGALQTNIGYSKIRSRNADTGDNLYAQPDKLSLGIKYQVDNNWSANYLGQFVRAQDYDDTLLRQRQGYATHDIGITYENSRYRADLGISNLFDKGYVTYQQTQATTYSYEEGRSVNLSFSSRF